VVGAFGLMILVHPPLALITALIVPATGCVTARYRGQMTKTWQALFRRVGDFNARIEDNVGGMRVVQAFTNEDHERRLFAEDNERYRVTKLQGLPHHDREHDPQLPAARTARAARRSSSGRRAAPGTVRRAAGGRSPPPSCVVDLSSRVTPQQ
jgi:ABC-type multidrug transport system fused ATPase/permease subunit